jgi:hypothetical protein
VVPESFATGVGSSVLTWFSSPAGCVFRFDPEFGASGIVSGVSNRNDEEPFAAMGRADVGRSYSCPFRIVPDRGKVGKDVGKSKPKESWDVLKHCESRSKYAKGIGNMRPEVSLIGCSLSFACIGEWLAGESCRKYVYGFHFRPVDRGQVVKVWDFRVSVREDLCRALVEVAHPRQVAADGHV